MNGNSALPSNALAGFRTRSIGVKLLIVCILALVMTTPMIYVGGVVQERTERAREVVQQISGYSGGPQTFLGPTLAIPYKIDPTGPRPPLRHRAYLVFPAQGSVFLKTSTEERRRSLFKVPAFQADMTFDASFDLTGVPAVEVPGALLDWDRAEIIVGVSDARGAQSDATLTAAGTSSTLIPTEIASDFVISADGGKRSKLTFFGVKIGTLAKPGAQFRVGAALRFSGAQRVALLSYGKTTRVVAQGDWPGPGFDGGFLPVRRTVNGNGFSAEWTVPFTARGVHAEGPSNEFTTLESTALGTSFIEVADPYQSVSRSTKYVLLFVGLIFLSYFALEAGTGKRVHPAQYVLVGIAQTIFYLLLLSLSERIGFDWGFLTAGSATVFLLAANAGWVFDDRSQGGRAFITFASLYTVIYLLLRMEDNALLVGATASFVAVAVVMYITRKVDWYGGSLAPAGAPGTVPPPLPPNAAC